ncbi:hypothetical protein K445DRAFT_143628 [Daldinia sp. EC12]|nr:hypothetical protein F4774DRAFT_41346 [Daldinia eschscholtzii]OTB14005.1 hypothetical protein K445DRAFT_143628 [Daldinia sp. EC12]
MRPMRKGSRDYRLHVSMVPLIRTTPRGITYCVSLQDLRANQHDALQLEVEVCAGIYSSCLGPFTCLGWLWLVVYGCTRYSLVAGFLRPSQ